MKEKIELITSDFDEKEKKKITKFLPSISLIDDQELKDTKAFLSSKNVKITKANQIKVYVNSLNELQNKYGIVDSALEQAYVENPNRLNINALEIMKRTNYCKQNNIEIKNEDGSYKDFLFSTTLWKGVIEDASTKDPIVENSEIKEPEEQETPIVEETESDNYFDKIRQELEATKQSLASEFSDISEDYDDLISFDELITDEIGGPQR